MADFCTLLDRNASPNQPNVYACAKSSWCEDYLHAITCGPNDSLGSIMDVQKCAKMNLGRVTSCFF